MRSVDRFHSPTPEELMEYLDGEGNAGARNRIEAHLADCDACRALVAEQRGLTTSLGAWQVAPAPASLQTPVAQRTRGWWRPSPAIAAGLAAAAMVLVVVAVNQRPAPGTIAFEEKAALRPATSPASEVVALGPPQASERAQLDSLASVPRALAKQTAVRTPSVIRTATVQIVAKDFAAARASVESIVTNASGFIDHMAVTGDTSQARVLRGTLRVPSDRLTEVLSRLRGLGQVVEDTQGSQDVTDQIVDLDARLASARATEQRLAAILRDRTGRLSDVLEVERARLRASSSTAEDLVV